MRRRKYSTSAWFALIVIVVLPSVSDNAKTVSVATKTDYANDQRTTTFSIDNIQPMISRTINPLVDTGIKNQGVLSTIKTEKEVSMTKNANRDRRKRALVATDNTTNNEVSSTPTTSITNVKKTNIYATMISNRNSTASQTPSNNRRLSTTALSHASYDTASPISSDGASVSDTGGDQTTTGHQSSPTSEPRFMLTTDVDRRGSMTIGGVVSDSRTSSLDNQRNSDSQSVGLTSKSPDDDSTTTETFVQQNLILLIMGVVFIAAVVIVVVATTAVVLCVCRRRRLQRARLKQLGGRTVATAGEQKPETKHGQDEATHSEGKGDVQPIPSAPESGRIGKSKDAVNIVEQPKQHRKAGARRPALLKLAKTPGTSTTRTSTSPSLTYGDLHLSRTQPQSSSSTLTAGQGEWQGEWARAPPRHMPESPPSDPDESYSNVRSTSQQSPPEGGWPADGRLQLAVPANSTLSPRVFVHRGVSRPGGVGSRSSAVVGAELVPPRHGDNNQPLSTVENPMMPPPVDLRVQIIDDGHAEFEMSASESAYGSDGSMDGLDTQMPLDNTPTDDTSI